ncbi:hypothetical protein GCK72_008747 [Caenorhabditis remanei]|uniref:F-box domain-containing protein n=1 Tax=Caenorhabditis remanei TaxID=31234 RepID=A0A6A5GYE3_CAERE|nr:hypothetical protein GCK72_008747 [Caenorhabditis remanei]KAF1760498.1 hypothetical protein GCK72_008747 [Caenorhabditis remanei]
MEPTFPLLRLPENVILEVIKNMAIDPLFEFSLISRKTKNIAASLGIKAQAFITICHFIDVSVYYGPSNRLFTFYNDPVDALIHLDSNQPISAYSLNENKTVRSSTPFSFNNWLDHIMTVFCYNKPSNVVFGLGNERFEMESVKNAITSANYLSVNGDNVEFRNREILEHFKNANELNLRRNPFEEACEVQKIFIRNFESITFHDDVSLDDMLLANSKRVELYRSISQKQFNQFLKHWIRGSNPRLERMSLQIDKNDSLNGELYLKGINCMETSENAKREIRREHHLPSHADIIQIRRKDGTTAVIGTNDSGDILNVRFMVLH